MIKRKVITIIAAAAGTLMQVSAGGTVSNANAISGIATDNLGNIYFTDMHTHHQ